MLTGSIVSAVSRHFSRASETRTVVFVATCLAILSGTAYAVLAARDIMFGDGAELTTAAVLGGVAHPPGYPLWIIIAHVFTLLPLGPMPLRVNLTAAVYHALTVGFVYAAGFYLTRRHVAAIAAAIALATTPLFLTWSLQAEVFSLNDVMVAAMALLCVLQLRMVANVWLTLMIAVLFGLGVSNQQTFVLLFPAVAYVLWRRRSSAKIIFGGAVLSVVGFGAPYLHTLLVSQHDLQWSFGAAPTLTDLLALITRRAYGTLNLVNGPLQGGSALGRVMEMCSGFGIIGIVGAAGLVRLTIARERTAGWFFVLALGSSIFLFCALANTNASIDAVRGLALRFALMPLVLLAPCAAYAIAALDGALSARRMYFAPVAAALLALAWGLPHVASASLADVHDARTLVRDEFASLPPGVVAFVKGDTLATTTPYFQLVEKWRPDLTLVYVDLLPSRRYAASLAHTLALPAGEKATLFDIIALNPKRDFYGIGNPEVQGAINGSGKLAAVTVGLSSQIVSRTAFVPLVQTYARGIDLQVDQDYGALSTHDDSPFAAVARTYYANGFYNLAIDAARLHELIPARHWLERASAYVPESPVIHSALAIVHKSVGDGITE